jgi:hypothetical protein
MCAQVVRESFQEILVPRWTREVMGRQTSAWPSAITHSMLALCSAADKARRVASTALARGLGALTPPPRSPSPGNCVMALVPIGRAGTDDLSEWPSGVHPPGSNRAFSFS